MTMNITGQCHCGAIRFTALVDPAKVFACHCADCQIFSGAPFRAVVPVPAGQVQMTGSPKHYVKVAASGNRRAQAFCADCGTQLYATEADEPKTLNIRLGCVTERAQLKPTVQLWRASGMPWLHDLDAAPAHGRGRDSPLL
ncbi:GFA family protein [Roseateles sp. BYS96W]|uniref:GFA family protein n=2 Tax=Pelomonas nitida TaxID=3299027 RepID=A0ABW7GAW5_9BURK